MAVPSNEVTEISQPGTPQAPPVQFLGEVYFNAFIPQPFVLNNKSCVYHFTRTAKAKIREEMVKYLINVLPGAVVAQCIRGEFDRLFCHHGYKEFFNDVGQGRSEWLRMQIPIFNSDGALQSVAHVYFYSFSLTSGPQQFTVPVRVSVITQSFTNPLLPGTSWSALPYPFLPNPHSMMPNVLSLTDSNHGAQELVQEPMSYSWMC